MPELFAEVPDAVDDESTEPMARAGTNPFEPPPRPALEQPAARAREARTLAIGIAARRIGNTGKLVAAVAAAGSLVVAIVATDAPRPSNDAPGERARTWSFPISELSESDAASELPALAAPAVSAADAAICEPDRLAPAPALPAAAPVPARRTSASRPAGERGERGEAIANDDATSIDDAPEAGEASLPHPELIESESDFSAYDNRHDDARPVPEDAQRHGARSDAPAP